MQDKVKQDALKRLEKFEREIERLSKEIDKLSEKVSKNAS